MFSEKDRLFRHFIKDWGYRFKEIKYILQYLNTLNLQKMQLGRILKPEELYDSQKEWVWLNSKFEGLEKEFFKPFWVPLTKEFDPYIDLSKYGYQLISTYYYFNEPMQWIKYIIFSNIEDLLLADEKHIDLTNLKEKEKSHVFRLMAKMDKEGKQGGYKI